MQVQTLNGIISELDLLEKAKLNSGLEVELLDFLQNEMENGSLVQMKEQNKSMVLGDTVMWLKKRFTNKPYWFIRLDNVFNYLRESIFRSFINI